MSKEYSKEKQKYEINFILNDKLYTKKSNNSKKNLKDMKIILLFESYEHSEPESKQLINIIYNKSKYVTINELVLKNTTFMKYIYNCKNIGCKEILKIHNLLV